MQLEGQALARDADALAHWAGVAGAHALALFFALLVSVLTVATALWWAWQRHGAPGAPGREATTLWFIALRLALGFAVIVTGAWVVAELAEALGAEHRMGRADQALTDALAASVPPGAVRMFAAITRLGDTKTLVALGVTAAIALVAARQRALAFGFVAALAGNGVLNTELKRIFARARPLHDDAVVQLGFSFPSGHSSGALVAYCMLAYVGMRVLPPRWHLPAVLAAVALAFTVGASRIFLRVHFASDVIAGFASGAAWLAVCIGGIELARWRRARV